MPALLRALAVVGLMFSSACLSSAAPCPPPALRLLSSEAPRLPAPNRERAEEAMAPGSRLETPRIGAPGGSGAGSRRIAPAQSGKDTVGGLPVGIGGSTGPAGRG